MPLVGGEPVIISFDVNGDEKMVNYLEHVEVLGNIQYQRRGCLEMDIYSPSGKLINI